MQSPIKMLTALCNLLGDYSGKSHPSFWRDIRAQWAFLPSMHLYMRHLSLVGECKGNGRPSGTACSVTEGST